MRANALGKIFKIEKQLGRGDLFEVIAAFPQNRTEKYIFQHEDCDGLGALLRLSRKWNSKELHLPAFKMNLKRSALWGGVRGLLGDLQPRKTLWKNLEKQAPYTPQHLARRVFDKSSSTAIFAAASEHKVNLNTLLLWIINHVVCEQLLLAQQHQCHWLLPVNTRRSEERQCDSNRTSSIGLHFDRCASLQDLFANYKKSLNPWHALGNERLTEFLARLSEKNLLALARLRGSKNSWIGSFSNLGRWDFPENLNDAGWPTHISIAPPAGTPCFPIGVGIITWQGHMSISLRLHAALCQENSNQPEAILDAAKQFLEDFVKLPLAMVDSSVLDEKNDDTKIQNQNEKILFSEHNSLCKVLSGASHSH
jgi:hypothetical protein